MSSSVADTSPTRGYYAALLAIIALGVLARLFHFQLALGCDDQLWLITARDLGEAYRTNVHPVFYSRILWRALLALWGTLAGSSLQSSAVLMFALSCLTVSMVAESGRIAFGRNAALLAALIYAMHPLNVVYDVKTLPDGLAVALLAASVFCFLKHLHHSRLVWLALSGFLVGLSYSSKDYYILAALPLGSCLLFEQAGRTVKFRNACLFSVCILAGLSVDFVLHFWESGNFLAHAAAVSGYGQAIAAGSSTDATGIHYLHSLFWQRLSYFEWLFVEGGIINGFLLLWGLLFLAIRSRECLDCRMLLMTAAVFLLFLAAMPAKLHPLLFVEMQPRYLTIVFPMLAIGAGAAISAALTSLNERALRLSLVAVLVVGFGYNVCVPNEMLDHYRVQEFVGIRKVLDNAGGNGITELVLPAKYELFLPDCYYSHGVDFTTRDVEDKQWFQAAADYLKSGPGRALFLPERPYPRTDSYKQLKELLDAKGFVVEKVRVPRSSYRSWLYRLDLHDANDQLVGWICRGGAKDSEKGNSP